MRVSDRNIDRIYINSLTRPANYKMAENHFHYYYEMYYVKQGQCRLFIANTPYNLSAGEFVIVPPLQVHVAMYPTNCTRINLYFRTQDACPEGEREAWVEQAKQPVVIHIPTAYRDIFEHVLGSMLQEEKVEDASSSELLTLLFRQFLLYAKRYGEKREDPKKTGISADVEIQKAVNYIREHYGNEITLNSMSDLTGLSPSYFSRKFHHVTGMGMKEYLTYVRLDKAQLELLSTNHTITEVALNCGFSNSNYFKDAFKKMYGMSPKAYRNSRKTDAKTAASAA